MQRSVMFKIEEHYRDAELDWADTGSGNVACGQTVKGLLW